MKRLNLLAVPLFLLAGNLPAETLPLETYLQQVKQGPDYARSITNRKSTDLNRLSLGRHWSGSFSFYGSRNSYDEYAWSYTDDKYVPYYQESFSLNAGAGFSNTWDFGLSTGINYNLSHSENWYVNYPYAIITPYNHMYDSFNLNANLSLWRNLFGVETQAQDKRDRLSSDASVDFNEFQIQSVLLNAKQAYYTLAGLRAEIAWRLESLDQYRKLWDGAKRRSAQDALQAQTYMETQEQALEHLGDSERSWRNVLNRYRGKDGSQVEETLQPLDQIVETVPADWDQAEPERLDLQGNRLLLEAQKYSDKIAQEGLKLPINLSLSAGGNLFRDDIPSSPYDASPFITNYSATLQFYVPFDLFTNLWDVNARRSKLQLDQSVLDLKETENLDSQVWEDMTVRYQKSTARIQKAGELEQHQKEKADKALGLLKAGRLGMFETLTFQDQYLTARLNRLSWLTERLSLLAQAELYRAQKSKGSGNGN